MEGKKIDVGSGRAHRAGYLTLDRDPATGADIIADLEQAWPFADNSLDEVRAHHIIEHVHTERKVFVMSEAWRVLRPGGVLDIEVPAFPHVQSVMDPTHVSFWCRESFMYFEDGNRFRDAFAARYSECPVPRFRITAESQEGFVLRVRMEAVK